MKEIHPHKDGLYRAPKRGEVFTISVEEGKLECDKSLLTHTQFVLASDYRQLQEDAQTALRVAAGQASGQTGQDQDELRDEVARLEDELRKTQGQRHLIETLRTEMAEIGADLVQARHVLANSRSSNEALQEQVELGKNAALELEVILDETLKHVEGCKCYPCEAVRKVIGQS